MRVFILSILLGFQLQVIAHGGHMATQTYSFSDSNVVMEFKISVATLEHYSLELFGDDFKLKKGFVLTNYINSKNDVFINHLPLRFELLSSEQDEDYLIVKLEAPYEKKQNSTIEITSKIFYEVDNHFENRIIVSESNGHFSSFRLTKENNHLKTQFT